MSITTKATPNPEEFKSIQEMRIRDDDVKNILSLYAADADLKRLCEDNRIRERMRLIPNAWRDLRMIQTTLSKITDRIQWTIPMEKRIGFARVAGRCKYILMQGPLAAKPKPNEEEIITTSELEELVASAWDGKCRMCIDDDCSRCGLGRVLDNVVAQDRNGSSWGMMDIRRKS